MYFSCIKIHDTCYTVSCIESRALERHLSVSLAKCFVLSAIIVKTSIIIIMLTSFIYQRSALIYEYYLWEKFLAEFRGLPRLKT